MTYLTKWHPSCSQPVSFHGNDGVMSVLHTLQLKSCKTNTSHYTQESSVWALASSSGKVAECNQPNTPRLTLQSSGGGCKNHEKCEWPSIKSVFGLSVLDYCRNMLVQNGCCITDATALLAKARPALTLTGCLRWLGLFLRNVDWDWFWLGHEYWGKPIKGIIGWVLAGKSVGSMICQHDRLIVRGAASSVDIKYYF